MELRELCEKMTKLFEIKNISELSEKLLFVCLENQHEYLEKFAETVEDLSVDWLQKIFQYYEADRKEKMQDYTPLTLARFVGKLTETENEKSVCDLCAGSGALTISKWNLNHDLHFVCYEYDKKVIPLLLFNLAVRNIDALVVHSDVLQDETFTRYTVKRGEKYGIVTEIKETVYFDRLDSCISNPPYNMKWKLPPFAQLQPRFDDFTLPPENNANYAFVLTALNICTKKSVLILPAGIADGKSNKTEFQIRKELVESNLIEAVISCPGNMFEATAVATVILVLNKNKDTQKIELVDMREVHDEEAREQRGQYGGKSHTNRVYQKKYNIFTDEQINRAISAIKEKAEENGFCRSVSLEEVRGHDYRLAPSIYFDVDFNDIPPHRAYADIVADINRVITEKNACKLTINASLAKTLGFNVDLYKADKQDSELNDLLKKLGAEPLAKQNYFTASKNKNEIKFENNSKDILSSILVMIMNNWKQHIYYLNNEENRYMAELRDALLNELVSGKIEL